MNTLIDKKIPIYILEEHNEAFFTWISSIKEQNLPRKNYTLWHFDDHSDMTTLRVNTPLKEVFSWSNDKLNEFTYNELTIASFIMAANFVGLFDHIIWCKIDNASASNTEIFTTSYNNDYKNLISGRQVNDNPLLKNYYSKTHYSKIGLNNFKCDSNKRVLLDIDLDFFSCNIQPENNQEIVLEITGQEYQDFQSNKYHPIRFICNNVSARIVEDSYYLIINYFRDIFPSPRRVSELVIRQRIQKFLEVLKSTEVHPEIITICRSVNSGYTPKDQWEFIEKQLLQGLKNIYDVQKPHFI